LSTEKQQMSELLKEEISQLIESEKFPKITSDYRKQVTERVLENQIKYLKGVNEASDAPTNTTGGVSNFDPILIKMVRRSMPQLMAFDLMGVQSMTGPTGSIFAMRSRYTNQTGSEALHGEANSAFTGTGSQGGDTSGFAQDAFAVGNPAAGTTYGTALSKAAGELLGSDGNPAWKEMAFSVERVDVSAKTRKLKAQFSRELQYDLKNIHGLDAETELANILSTEIVAEIDREALRTINVSATLGAQTATVPGMFDIAADSDGRWLVERFKGLLFQIELEANAVAKATRRGRANRIVCSSNVASALNMAGVLDYNPAYAANLNVDDTAQTYAGVLMGKYQVFIDPYATVDYVTVAYRGANAWDAGVYYCPYLPLELYRTVGESTFNPVIGFATRYGVVANPFASHTASGAKTGLGLGQGENPYYRKMAVANITGV
jgi:hypothetical protein